MVNKVGLRERNRRERRKKLESVGIELFTKKGFNETTIEEITTAAGLAPRTFFSYFSTKDDLVLADYAERLSTILRELDNRPRHEQPWTALTAAFENAAADYEVEAERIRQRFLLIMQNSSIRARHLVLQTEWEVELAQHLQARLGASNTDILPRLLAATALAIMRTSLQLWLVEDHNTALPDLVVESFDKIRLVQ